MQTWTLKGDEISAQHSWNWHSWLIEVRHDRYPQDPEAVQILSEAWGWLQAKCLIAWTFDQSSTEAFTITRRGHEFLRQGTRWLRLWSASTSTSSPTRVHHPATVPARRL